MPTTIGVVALQQALADQYRERTRAHNRHARAGHSVKISRGPADSTTKKRVATLMHSTLRTLRSMNCVCVGGIKRLGQDWGGVAW